MKIIASILFLLLIYLQISLWFGAHGVFELWSLRADIQEEKNSNEQLVARNERLHARVKELKAGREALEERARSQLGFIKEGEVFYQVIPKPEATEAKD